MSLNKELFAAQQGDKKEIQAMMLKNKLEKLFLEERKVTEERYGLHASAIIASENEFCYRQQILSLFYKQNQGEQLPIKLLKIFAQGNAMHEKWYKLFRATGVDVAIERTLFIPEYDLNFTIDALLDFNKPLGKEPDEIICDVKSQNSFVFKKSKGHPSGEKQVNFYCWALSHYTKVPHRKGFVLVDSKDDQEVRCVPVEYDKEKVRPYIERLKKVQVLKKEFLEEHKVPKRKCESCDCKQASKCSMRDACWNIGQGRIKLDGKKIRKEKKDRG